MAHVTRVASLSTGSPGLFLLHLERDVLNQMDGHVRPLHVQLSEGLGTQDRSYQLLWPIVAEEEYGSAGVSF